MKDDSDDDSAIEDPNTESLKSRPRSVQVPPPGSEILQPQVFTVSGPRLSPPTKMRSGTETAVPGISQLRVSKSPVRNLFPDPARTQSRSSTLVDAESLHESSHRDQSKSRSLESSRPQKYLFSSSRSFIPAPASRPLRDGLPARGSSAESPGQGLRLPGQAPPGQHQPQSGHP